MRDQSAEWEWEIDAKTSWFGTSLKELVRYKDLLFQLVRRNYVLYYQQTLLGPLWMIVNPILTALVYVVVFSQMMRLPTDGVPALAFYLTGIALWTLFSDIFAGTSNIYGQNAYMFSKVYFPRIIVPYSTTLLHLLRFCIQLAIVLSVVLYFYIQGTVNFSASRMLLIFPPVILIAFISLGLGLLLSVIAAKYKDVTNLFGLLTRLLMFVCPIFYPVSIVPEGARWFVELNPLSPLFEMFRYALLGVGSFNSTQLMFSTIFSFLILIVGLLLFNKTTDKVVDVV
jgi:lipopolysaccharide transport system permease protein